jgi:hypothetical protein
MDGGQALPGKRQISRAIGIFHSRNQRRTITKIMEPIRAVWNGREMAGSVCTRTIESK